jgi:hypothetical protein
MLADNGRVIRLRVAASTWLFTTEMPTLEPMLREQVV